MAKVVKLLILSGSFYLAHHYLKEARKYTQVIYCSVRWARERLLSQHKANSEYNYLLIQKQDDLLSYDIFVYVENVQPKANMPPVAHFTINRLSHGKYQVNSNFS